MASDEVIKKLIAQTKSQDIDAKIEALGKLQLEFEAGVELTDIEEAISALKNCLRTPNQHLTTATTATLPSFFRLLFANIPTQSRNGEPSTSPTPAHDAHAIQHIRHALLAFLPAGGLIDRLGENRERPRELAREALVTIAGIAFKLGGGTASTGSGFKNKDVHKGQESPLSIVERHVKDLGLGSKVSRVREQTLISLVRIRQDTPTFPIRFYLPVLVDLLEDSDGTVRDCARTSVIALFTGPKVSDAARADLKSEMTKRGVRKGIVTDILAKLLAGSIETLTDKESESVIRKPLGIGRSATASTLSRTFSSSSMAISVERPPSSASMHGSEATTPVPQSTDILPVYIASAKDMEHEFSKMVPAFEGKETEHNWLLREEAVIAIRGMLKGDAHVRFPDAFIGGLKGGILDKTLKALLSLRTTVGTQAALLYGELAIALQTAMDPLVETVLTHLLRMSGFTKRLIVQQTQASVTQILRNTSCQPRLTIHLVHQYLQDKTVQTRQHMIVHVRTILEVHGQKSRSIIESSGALDLLDQCVRKAISDPNPQVREQARLCYWVFESLWPNNARAISAALDNTAKKLLEKTNPNPSGGSSILSDSVAATPTSKKSSIAAVIAASRAKAKVIATAPPTLRHAATSGAAAAAALSLNGSSSPPPVRRPGSPSTSFRRVTSPAVAQQPASAGGTPAGGLASPPASRSSSPSPLNPKPMRPSLGTKPAPIPKPLPRANERATHSPSPPSSPTQQSPLANRRRTSSPLISTMRSSSHQIPRSLSPPNTLNFSSRGIGGSSIRATNRPDNRPSLAALHRSTANRQIDDGEDLLRASHVPLPIDSDLEDDPEQSFNLMSFSSVYETYGPAGSPDSNNGARRRINNGVPDSVIHDSLRAQAQQAESAAAQLLELVHDDIGTAGPILGDLPGLSDNVRMPLPPPPRTDSMISSVGHSSLGSSTDIAFVSSPVPILEPTPAANPQPSSTKNLPVTPRHTRLINAVNEFQNSPAVKHSPSLASALFERNDKTGAWWRARKRFLNEDLASMQEEPSLSDCIQKLESETATVDDIQHLIGICSANPCNNTSVPPSPSFPSKHSKNGMLTPSTPSPLNGFQSTLSSTTPAIWEGGKPFDSLLKALFNFLKQNKSEKEVDFGLMLLLEMVLKQGEFLNGNESALFSFLFRIRYADRLNVYEATNAIRDGLIEKCDPVFGLTTIHRNLTDFLKLPVPETSLSEARTSSYCFGLVGISKFMLLLPPEVLEDELPRIKGSLMTALSDPSPAVREAGYVAIIAAQIKLRDETHLFALLGGLSETQKHLLTYEFEKLKTRGKMGSDTNGANGAGSLQKLAGKMRHLDALPSPSPLGSS